jgi:hypothetical protein
MKDTGGPAFPVVGHMYGEKLGGQLDHGMTLRDYFAAMASDADIEALRERTKRKEVQISSMGRREISLVVPREWRQIARYMHADAMLAERSKE